MLPFSVLQRSCNTHRPFMTVHEAVTFGEGRDKVTKKKGLFFTNKLYYAAMQV